MDENFCLPWTFWSSLLRYKEKGDFGLPAEYGVFAETTPLISSFAFIHTKWSSQGFPVSRSYSLLWGYLEGTSVRLLQYYVCFPNVYFPASDIQLFYFCLFIQNNQCKPINVLVSISMERGYCIYERYCICKLYLQYTSVLLVLLLSLSYSSLWPQQKAWKHAPAYHSSAKFFQRLSQDLLHLCSAPQSFTKYLEMFGFS